jgi:hypothetical protein
MAKKKAPFVHGALNDLGEAKKVDRVTIPSVVLPYRTGRLTLGEVIGEPILSMVESIAIEFLADLASAPDVARIMLHPDNQRLRCASRRPPRSTLERSRGS